MKKKVVVFFLAMLLFLLPAGVAVAATEGASHSLSESGITVTVSTDKSEYEAGEEIHYTIQVENNRELYVVSTKSLVYKNSQGLLNAQEGNLPFTLPEIAAGESCELSGILKGDEAVFPIVEASTEVEQNNQEADCGMGAESSIAGEELQEPVVENRVFGLDTGVLLPVVIAVIVLAVAGILFFVFRNKKARNAGKKLLLFVLVSGMLLGSVSATNVFAADTIGKSEKLVMRPYVEFLYGGEKVMVRAVITFELTMEKEKFSLKEYEGAKRTTCHDPSIFKDFDGTYYIFGTHMGMSTTTDLKDWTNRDNAFRNTFDTETRVAIREWNKDDYAGSWYDYLWAPDVIYNEAMGKYCMYLSANGDNWKSNIVLLTADVAAGPYEYAGSIVYGGFDETNWTETDVPKALGTDALPQRYLDYGVKNAKWGDEYPNCIDPTVFYDDKGNLWMAYGSWSGGIFILELDEQTGLRDYTVTYETNAHSDAYFGTKIAGGKYVSGEGAYIEKIGDYYWLFISYGNLEAKGGYNVRVFRSERPDGGYVDALGNDAYSDKYIYNYNLPDKGVRLFGGYQWRTFSLGEVAQGHNSAFVDEDGRAHIVYHTRTTDGSEGHTVRVHQLFLNKEGWLVAAPYQTREEVLDPEVCTVENIAGKYEVILHELDIEFKNLDTMRPEAIYLNADGTITGYYEGSWAVEEGTSYITLTLDGKAYSGVALEMQVENLYTKTMVFTALGQENQLTVWGSKSITK